MKKNNILLIVIFLYLASGCKTQEIQEQCTVDKEGLEKFTKSLIMNVESNNVRWIIGNTYIGYGDNIKKIRDRAIASQVFKSAKMIHQKYDISKLLIKARTKKENCSSRFGRPFVKLYQDKLLLIGAVKDPSNWVFYYRERFEFR